MGVFKIEAKEAANYFKITCVGYYDTIAKISPDIRLRANKIALNEIKVVPRKFEKTVKLGKAKRGDNHYGIQWDSKIGMTAKYFPNNKVEGKYVSKVRFFATASEKNRLISVVVYSVGEDGKPDEILNTENLVYKLKKGTHVVEANLDRLNIEFPANGIFIIIQHPLLEQNKNYCKDCHNPNAFFYEPLIAFSECDGCKDYRYFQDGDWFILNNRSLNIELVLTD